MVGLAKTSGRSRAAGLPPWAEHTEALSEGWAEVERGRVRLRGGAWLAG